MGDESLRDHTPFLPGPNEPLSADEGFVPRVRPGDRHVNRWIAATNFPQPCQRGSAVGIPYFCPEVCTVASTSSLGMFSWLVSSPMTFPPPRGRVKNRRHSISSSTVSIRHAPTPRRHDPVLLSGA